MEYKFEVLQIPKFVYKDDKVKLSLPQPAHLQSLMHGDSDDNTLNFCTAAQIAGV